MNRKSHIKLHISDLEINETRIQKFYNLLSFSTIYNHKFIKYQNCVLVGCDLINEHTISVATKAWKPIQRQFDFSFVLNINYCIYMQQEIPSKIYLLIFMKNELLKIDTIFHSWHVVIHFHTVLEIPQNINVNSKEAICIFSNESILSLFSK